MSSKIISQFESSLQGFVADCRVVSASETAETINLLMTQPAVGVPISIEEVSLADLNINLDPTAEEIRTAETGITGVGMAIASYGTVTIESSGAGDELISLYPPNHIAIVPGSNIVSDMNTAFDTLSIAFKQGRTSHIFATGPSATADLGGLIQGVHGPEQVSVIIVEDR